jgi:tRNA A37 methylthiotransferase MiaB
LKKRQTQKTRQRQAGTCRIGKRQITGVDRLQELRDERDGWDEDDEDAPATWEEANPEDATELAGRTECNRVVNFPGGPNMDRWIGQMADVRITQGLSHSLRGELLIRD